MSVILRVLKKNLLLTSSMLAFTVVIAFWFRDFIASKLSFYLGLSSSGVLLRLALFMLLILASIVLVKRQLRARFNFTILALSVAIYFLGSERLTMIVYFFVILYVNLHSKLAVGLVLIMSLYLAYKTFSYLSMIVNFGG